MMPTVPPLPIRPHFLEIEHYFCLSYLIFRQDLQDFQDFFWLSFPAESGMAVARFRLETEKSIGPINPVNPACPVAPADGTGAPLFTQLNFFCTYLTGA